MCETNAKNFNSGNKSMCKKCARKMSRNEISLEERIYKRAMKGAKSRNINFELDVKYIKELLEIKITPVSIRELHLKTILMIN